MVARRVATVIIPPVTIGVIRRYERDHGAVRLSGSESALVA
jgi:hypothetical protein